jgi:hypothetical protein
MWVEPWKQEQWVISRSASFYLSCAFWAQLPLWLISPFLAYVAYLAFRGRPIGPLSGWVELLLGIVGGVGAFCGIALRDAMRIFHLRNIHSGQPQSKVLAFALKFVVFVGPSFYYWFVYRPRMREAGFN